VAPRDGARQNRFDPDFAARAVSWGGGFIVAGQNYGQGSSREHAALAPKHVGVSAVLALSFARIHRRNLIAQGIVPLVFADEADQQRARQGATLEVPGIRVALQRGVERIAVRVHETGEEFAILARCSPREREVHGAA
jgi:aconitate hydratase